MNYTFKNIAVFFDDTNAGLITVELAAQVASTFQSRLICACATLDPQLKQSSSFAKGQAIAQVIQEQKEKKDRTIRQLTEKVRELSDKYHICAEFRDIYRLQNISHDKNKIFYCDLAIASIPHLPGVPLDDSPERMLLRAGVPILITPSTWQNAHIGKKIVVAWNESRVARRAISDAMPFLTQAQSVMVLCVNPDPSTGDGEPGHELAGYLRHHGVDAHVKLTDANQKTVAQTIHDESLAFGADLLIVGAYSHSRLSERLLGGTTRFLLEHVSLPLFISH